MNKILGKKVKNYQIMQFLGRGASATVYRAEEINTKNTVALKIFDQSNYNTQQNVKRQVHLLQSLDHPNIIKCNDIFFQKNTWYIVLEYCGKGDLQIYAKSLGKMKEDEAQSHIHKLLDSLSYLHSKKIVHRDLKLANILINDLFEIKLADFGLSKNYQESLLQSQTGTPLTMAPQILLGSGNKQVYTQKCDTWSLGVITYLLICGDYPFKPGKKSNIGGIEGLKLEIKNSKQICFPKNINISPMCKDFIISCLKINPTERPYISQLMDHEWMKQTSLVSTIRIGNMKNVFGIQSPAIDQFKYLLYTQIKLHIVSLIKKKLMTNQQIPKIVKLFQQIYPQNYGKYLDLLKFIIQKNSSLRNINIKIIFKDKIFMIKGYEINNLKNHTQNIQKIIQKKLAKIQQKIKQINDVNCNVQRSLLQLITNDGLEQTFLNKQKIYLWKSICEMIGSKLDSTQIEIKYLLSDQKFLDYEQLYQFVSKILTNQQISTIINEDNIFNYSEDEKVKEWEINHNFIQSKDSQEKFSELDVYAKILLRALNCKFQILNSKNINLSE